MTRHVCKDIEPGHVAISAADHGALATVAWKMEDEERSPRCEANAKLISAAPQMFSALAAFYRAAKSWHDFHHGSKTIQCDWLCECIKPAEAALRAAGAFTAKERADDH